MVKGKSIRYSLFATHVRVLRLWKVLVESAARDSAGLFLPCRRLCFIFCTVE